jgi:hypothetical protein
VDSGRDARRANIRMRLAFWQAQDRRSVTTGPVWLWRGRHVAPLRQADLSEPTSELISRRRARGMPVAALFGPAGPRQARLPRWATPRSVVYGAITTMLLALVWLECVRAADDRAGVGVLAGGGAVVCAAGTLIVVGLLAWSRRDPLRLSPAQIREVETARRVLKWNPLAGAGPISPGGAYLLESLSAVAELVDSPAWTLPGVDVLRWRFDPDEEIFQIARAAHCLDLHERDESASSQTTGCLMPAERSQRRYLTDTLLDRLVVLHRCVGTLNAVQQLAQRSGTGNVDAAEAALFSAAAGNELAAGAWSDLNTDLLAMVDGYAALDQTSESGNHVR